MSKILKWALPLFLLSTSPIFGNEIPKLTLNGQAILHKHANQMSLTLGVTTLGNEAENTLSENSQKMQKIIAELEHAGLEKSEFQTGQFNIQPTYAPYPKNPPTDWKPTINGYEVTNTIVIKTDKIKQVGSFIDAASRAGANKVDNIQASLKDERAYWEEAISQATKNAIADAKVMAEAANVKLGRLLSLSLNDTHIKPPQPLAPMFLKAMAVDSESTPIEPGELEIKANVTVVYEIGRE